MSPMRSIILVGLTAVALYGCNSSQVKVPDGLTLNTTRSDFIRTSEKKAREYEVAGALREAQREWLIIDAAMGGGSSSARAEAARLGRAAKARAKRHLKSAKAAKKRSDFRRAKLELLKVLALKPDDAEAIKMLKTLERRRSYASLAAAPRVSDIVQNEVDVYTAPSMQSKNHKGGIGMRNSGRPVARSSPANRGKSKTAARSPKVSGTNFRRGLTHLSRNEYELALKFFVVAEKHGEGPAEDLDKYLAETRKLLADQHYNQGVVAFRAAHYDRAVNEFALALEYSPGHRKARFYHSSAKTLQGK